MRSTVRAVHSGTARPGSSRATSSPSSAGPCPSTSWTTRTRQTSSTRAPTVRGRPGDRRGPRGSAGRRHARCPIPEDAWGNAAIPGFGIGRPVREPELDEAANRPAARDARRRRPLPPDVRDRGRTRSILAAAPDAPLVDRHGRTVGRGRVAAAPVPRRAAGRDPRDRVGDGARGHARRRARRDAADAVIAALFAVGLLAVVVGVPRPCRPTTPSLPCGCRIDKAWANIDVALKQRFDQLPNLVEAVRGVMAWEQEVLTEVTAARAAYSPLRPIPEQAATSAATTPPFGRCSRSSSTTRRSDRPRTSWRYRRRSSGSRA